jgi:hypothetical protein
MYFEHIDGKRRCCAQVLIRGDPEVKVSVTSCHDIARWLPEILLDPTCRNATINVCSQVVSLQEAVQCFEEVSGKDLCPRP